MNRSSRIIAAGATAAAAFAGLGLGGVAQASGPSRMLSSATVTQNRTVMVTASCPGSGALGLLGSAALPGTGVVPLAPQSGPWKVKWHIGHVMPGMYVVGLGCAKGGKLTGFTQTMLTVKMAAKPFPPTPPGPRVVFGPIIVIHSGFGGMARQVASHHPAG